MSPLLPRWIERPETRGPTFFVSWWLRTTQRVLDPAERDLVCSVLRHGDGQRYSLLAYVVMDNHVHVLVRVTGLSVDRLVHSWTSFTAHQLQHLFRRRGTVWDQDGVTIPIAKEEVLRTKTEYIVGNPWKRWPFLKRYPWVWESEDGGTEVRSGG